MPEVYAFQPRKIDPPQHVADDWHQLVRLMDTLIGGDQCDNCGNIAYRVVESHKSGQITAQCTMDPDDDVSRQFGGCGTHYLIRLYDEDEVTF